jgi:hypothetical protein
LTILAGISFERWNPKLNFKQTKLCIWVTTFIIGVLVIGGFIFSYSDELSAFFKVFKANEAPPNLSIRSLLFYNSLFILMVCAIALITIRKINNFKNVLLILLIVDLLIYSQVSSSYTVHYPNKNASYTEYFSKLPNEVDQTLTTIPYKNLIENYEPKLEGIWRNTATFHKKLSFDGHNQTQFSRFNQIEKNRKIEFAKENNIIYELSADASNLTIPKANATWNAKNEKINVNPDTAEISAIRIGFNHFNGQVKNESTQTDWVVLNQNFHHLWQAKFNDETLPIHLINEAFMGVEIPAKSEGSLTFEFNSPNLKYAVIIALFSYVIFIALLIFTKSKTKKESLNG